MNTDVEPNHWTCLDRWWDAYARTSSIARNSVSARVLDVERLSDRWDELDPWLQARAESSLLARDSASTRVFGRERPSDCWDELDPWWDAYAETGYETAVAISDLLERANEEWKHSEAPFDADPLAADLTGERFPRGPIQPSVEVSWSKWLAQLLRPSAALTTELFDVPVDRAPSEVVREDQLSKRDGSFRRPDVLLFHADRGVSIEVKLDDENYEKTAETARLVERHYDDREWSHVLLLPEGKTTRLDALVDPPISRRDGQLRVEWDDPGPVGVKYWRDVTAAIRSLLRRGAVVDDHWAANAYLFCAVAEQRIVNFQPQPVIERLAEPANVVDAVRPIAIDDALGEQLSYLRERVDP